DHDDAIAHFPPPRPPRRGRVSLPSLAAGVLLALSLPPFGWWPLAWVGFAVLTWRLMGLGWRSRLLAGAMAGLGQFGIGLWWVNEFHSVGYVALVLLELAYIAVAAALVPPGRSGLVAFPAAMVLAEWARGATPLG